eukprot:s336_g6.t1
MCLTLLQMPLTHAQWNRHSLAKLLKGFPVNESTSAPKLALNLSTLVHFGSNSTRRRRSLLAMGAASSALDDCRGAMTVELPCADPVGIRSERSEEMMQELFRLHDLNSNGVLEEAVAWRNEVAEIAVDPGPSKSLETGAEGNDFSEEVFELEPAKGKDLQEVDKGVAEAIIDADPDPEFEELPDYRVKEG